MQFVVLSALVALAGASNSVASPVDKIITLITDLKDTIEGDGKKEAAVYDTYSCWCEQTLASKAGSIALAQTTIETMQNSVTKLGGELGALSAQIKQLTKDVADNAASQNEATAARTKANGEYNAARAESETSIGALEAGIKVLTGAGAPKTKFLQAVQESSILSTVGGLRGLLSSPNLQDKASASDLELVQQFVDHPEKFQASASSMSAMQVDAQNPFGDYAPASTQIQGVLKGIYDGFTADLEKNNVDEANDQKSYEALMATKASEEKTLKASLAKAKGDSAAKTKERADNRGTLNDTKEQLAADQKFFEQTKESCKAKSMAWNTRSRLRTEELAGMAAAISILKGGADAFQAATTTFVQISARASENRASVHLRTLAAKYRSASLLQVASEVSAGGHFDSIIQKIEIMMKKLDEEAKSDLAHRDRCESKQLKNKNAMEDLEFNIGKFSDTIGRMTGTETEISAKIKNTEAAVADSEKTIKAMKDQRAKENADFIQATKDDLSAIATIKAGIAALTKFYQDNKIQQGTALLQQEPDSAAIDSEYGGQKSGSTKIVALLSMLQEDLEKEVEEGKQTEAAVVLSFKGDLKDVEDVLDAQKKTKADADSALAAIKRQIVFATGDKTDANADLDGEKDMKKAIAEDCDWIKTDFKKRTEKRKLEALGLVEAKEFLAGAVLPR